MWTGARLVSMYRVVPRWVIRHEDRSYSARSRPKRVGKGGDTAPNKPYEASRDTQLPKAVRSASTNDLSADEYARLVKRCTWYVIAGALIFALLYAGLAWLRYRTYIYGGRFDLGNMVQAVYNTAHGRVLETTSADFGAHQVSRLASHVDPIIAAFAIPWLVWPSPVMLLVLQAAIVATGAWPAYRLGAKVTRDPRAGALLAGAFLLYPALGFLVLDEFHPVALATPLLLFAFLYMEENRWVTAVPFLLLAALCKEDIPLVVAAMGAYFALRKRSWRPLLLTAAALAYFAFALRIVIPHYNAGGTPFADRYSAYGDSAGEMVRTAAARPEKLLADVFGASNAGYVLKLLWPFVFAPLLSPLTLLISAPELLLNALSAKNSQRSIELHYTAAEIPFLYAAATLGLMRLRGWLGTASSRISTVHLALVLLIACLLGNYLLGPLPFPTPAAAYSSRDYRRPPHAVAMDKATSMIPDRVVISVTNNAGSVLSARPRVLTFPAYEGAEYVLVDQAKPDIFDVFDPQAYTAALHALERDGDYRSVFAEDGIVVFERIH